MLVILGIALMLAVVGAVIAVVVLVGRQEREERSPGSEPSDFVAPSSRSHGGYEWRQVDESADQFKARVAREDAGREDAEGKAQNRSG